MAFATSSSLVGQRAWSQHRARHLPLIPGVPLAAADPTPALSWSAAWAPARTGMTRMATTLLRCAWRALAAPAWWVARHYASAAGLWLLWLWGLVVWGAVLWWLVTSGWLLTLVDALRAVWYTPLGNWYGVGFAVHLASEKGLVPVHNAPSITLAHLIHLGATNAMRRVARTAWQVWLSSITVPADDQSEW